MTPDALCDWIERGDTEAVAAALRADPSLVRATTGDGDTAVHIACWQKQRAILGHLIAHGPDLDARGCYGRTPLHYAVHEGGAISAPIVALLLSLGADPTIKDDLGFTVADWARVEMDEGLAEVLALLNRPRAPKTT